MPREAFQACINPALPAPATPTGNSLYSSSVGYLWERACPAKLFRPASIPLYQPRQLPQATHCIQAQWGTCGSGLAPRSFSGLHQSRFTSPGNSHRQLTVFKLSGVPVGAGLPREAFQACINPALPAPATPTGNSLYSSSVGYLWERACPAKLFRPASIPLYQPRQLPQATHCIQAQWGTCGSGLAPRSFSGLHQSRFTNPGNCATSFWLLNGARMNPR